MKKAIISAAASSLRSASVPTQPRKVSRIPKAFTTPLVPIAFAASTSRKNVKSHDSSKFVSAKMEKSSKSHAKESNTVSTTSNPVKISAKPKAAYEKGSSSRDSRKEKPTLKELQAKKYPFPDSDLEGMLEDLLEKKIIDLPESKHPKEMGKTSDPNYCKYHRLVSHPIEKCVTLKEKIMQLARDGKIILDEDEAVESNYASVSLEPCTHGRLIQFGSLEPVMLQVFQPPAQCLEQVKFARETHEEDGGGWTLVTRRRPKKKVVPQPPPLRQQKRQRRRKDHKRSKGKKRKDKSTNKFQSLPVGLLEQKRREPVTLEEFFPETYFHEVSINTVTCSLAEEEKSQEEKKQVDEKGLNHKADLDKDAKILALLDTVPSRMGWHNTLSLPEKTRYALARVMENPTRYTKKENVEQGIYENHPNDCAACKAACSATLAFTDDDLVLGSKPHNRPLFMSGYIRKQRVNRILVDGGSAVNIMPKSTMTELGITADELNQSRLMIQGFNLGGQRAIGMIRVDLTIGEMMATTIFHVIDAKTSYKLLLGRTWMHENGVVASTLHQCLKYYRNGVQKVITDVKPFGEVESHFADAKFYVDEKEPLEVMPTEVPSTGKVQFHAPKAVKEEGLVIKESESRISSLSSKKNVNDGPSKEIKVASTSPAPVLRYVPKSRRKEGQSPFLNCADRCKVKATNSLDLRVQIANEGITLPIQQSRDPKIVKASLPEVRKDGFDQVAYKLMESSGYDFSNPEPMGKVVEAKAYGLNQTQQKLQKKGECINIRKVGLGFTKSKPDRITARGKTKQTAQYIAAMEVEESEGENDTPVQKNSVFDRIKPPLKHSIFDRLETRGEGETPKQVFQRPGKRENNVPSCLSKKGIFSMLGDGSKILKSRQPKKASVFSRINKGSKKEWRPKKKAPQTNSDEELEKEVKSIIPSRMKRLTTWEVKTGESLTMKGRTVVMTNQPDNTEQEKEGNVESVVASNHITVCEVSTPEDEEVETSEAPESLEDGGQATVDELKELNLGTKGEPRPVYVSALLSQEEEDAYFNLLKEYRDVFAWSYKEMPGLDPKVAAHRLAIKKGVSPKKQPRRRFRPELIPEIEAEV
ncbi:Sal-like protein 4 [Bienertia sinuspersici]